MEEEDRVNNIRGVSTTTRVTATTDASGHCAIEVPFGHARIGRFDAPPGYWSVGGQGQDWVLSAEAPVATKDLTQLLNCFSSAVRRSLCCSFPAAPTFQRACKQCLAVTNRSSTVTANKAGKSCSIRFDLSLLARLHKTWAAVARAARPPSQLILDQYHIGVLR